jgi:hypothetical protein
MASQTPNFAWGRFDRAVFAVLLGVSLSIGGPGFAQRSGFNYPKPPPAAAPEPSPPPLGSFAPGSSAPSWTPSIDTRNVNQAKYQKDYADCRTYAEADPTTDGKAQGKKKAMKWGLGGLAVAGAAIVLTGGVAAIAVLPAMAAPTALYAGGAAAAGGLSAKAGADAKYRAIVGNCLLGRGYTVLN